MPIIRQQGLLPVRYPSIGMPDRGRWLSEMTRQQDPKSLMVKHTLDCSSSLPRAVGSDNGHYVNLVGYGCAGVTLMPIHERFLPGPPYAQHAVTEHSSQCRRG